ncbi:MORC family CW-type zinc finger protein 3-like [Haliotis rufescens]|uniref:MORC family CW-type zinc finger protein 3-like n=1 Tax=Haliotis rufescens TaxID=6454 RepID=UPI00201F007D|nr:MORC family CW-type zinc finger protein 3-like [Haliotis rufescens]
MANLTGGIPLSKVSPNFLHANSTSHTWPFSAMAELIDNAYDPDVNASELWIDKVEVGGLQCMTFADNGNGLDEDKLLKMLSFGFCEKDVYEKSNHKPIGHYGNGFKSGSMRLGQDALVFTRHVHTTSVGMLSQTYLQKTGCETVMVPIITWELPSNKKIHSGTSQNNLAAIMKYSPFTTESSLLTELLSLERLKTGTKIFIFNLKRSKSGSPELDFESDPLDIRNPETLAMDMTTVYRPMQESTPEFKSSLREYCSILFLKPRMKIVLRGQKVKTKLISKSLSHTEIDLYKPGWLGRPLKIVFGFTCSKDARSENYGLMMYHKNRLIKAYEKVGYQRQRNNLGEGVVGVVQVDFLQPIHNKQDFNKDEKYNSFMTSIAQKLNDYWNEKKCGGSRVQVAPAGNLPDWLWAQCENCLKWRRLPDGVRQTGLPDRWFCHMNPDASHNRCDVEEEPEDEDEALNRPTYEKTYKKQQEEKRKLCKMEEQQRRIQKERELQDREVAIQRTLQRINQGEVTSSKNQMRKDVVNLEKALIESKKREALQKRLILQLQEQKKQQEQQKGELLKAAENLRVVNMENNNLLEKAENLAGNSPVSSTSGNNKNQNMCFKTEDGEVINIVENDDPANPQEKQRNTGKRKPATELIDLTLEDEDMLTSSPTPSKMFRTDDIKPDKDELDEQLLQNSDGAEAGGPKSPVQERKGTEGTKEKSKDVKPSIEELDQEIDVLRKANSDSKKQRKMTVSSNLYSKSKEKQIAPRKEKDKDALCDSETKQRYEELKKMYSAKCTEVTQTMEELKALQDNVHRLLRIIVPDVELGDAKDIRYIVEEMIRVNSDESLLNAASAT